MRRRKRKKGRKEKENGRKDLPGLNILFFLLSFFLYL